MFFFLFKLGSLTRLEAACLSCLGYSQGCQNLTMLFHKVWLHLQKPFFCRCVFIGKGAVLVMCSVEGVLTHDTVLARKKQQDVIRCFVRPTPEEKMLFWFEIGPDDLPNYSINRYEHTDWFHRTLTHSSSLFPPIFSCTFRYNTRKLSW